MVKRKHPDALCEECPLYSKPCAPSLKPPQPVAAIVSRSPGYHEGMAGKPFAGTSGKVLDHLLKLNGVSRDDVLITNTVLCAPDAGEVPGAAIKACAPRLQQEIADIPTVLACGREAVNLLVGRGAIDRYRGQRIKRNGQILIAANNPALVLWDNATFPNLRRDFQRAFNPLPEPTFPTVEVIEDAATAAAFLKDVPPGIVACDIESRGGLTHKAELISLQVAVDGGTATVLGERGGLWFDTAFIHNSLRPFLESKDRDFIWHGGKFDTKILRHTYGINARVDEDTMLLSYALDERSGSDERIGVHGLDYLLMDRFGWPYYSSSSVEKAKKTGVVEDYDKFYRYAGMDVGGTKQLFDLLYAETEKSPDLLQMYYEELIEGTKLVIDMELEGMHYDVQRASDVYEFEVEPELRKLEREMRGAVGSTLLNPRSPMQLAVQYYDTWGVKHDMQSRPDMQRSVDESARAEIIADRFTFRGEKKQVLKGNQVYMVPDKGKVVLREQIQEFAKMHERHAKLQKQASTYLVKMIERAEADPDGKVYTWLSLHSTNSGRLSSSRPNLQNITRTKPELPDIRRLFRSSAGRAIVQADFSQAELRCIAHMSGDKLLSAIYLEGRDLHNETAERFYGKDFTSEQRGKAKNMDFGVFYRQTAATFQEKHGIPEKEAQKFIDWIWSTFLGVKAWEEGIETQIRTKGVLVSPFGRRRRFYLLTRENIQAAFREGINWYPQSTASDITLRSAIRMSTEIDRSRAALILSVHDSILGDVVESYVDEYKVICKQVMESTPKDILGWEIPFVVDIGVGPTWGEAK